MPREINAARLERKLRSILGAAGSNILGDLDDASRGLVVLESDRPEWAFGGGEVLTMGQGQIAPEVAARGRVVLLNPANSGVLIVIEQVIALVGGGALVYAGLDFRAAVAANEGNQGYFFRDSRHASTTSVRVPSGQLLTPREPVPVDLGTTSLVFNAPSASVPIPVFIVIQPGWNFYTSSSLDNVSVTVSYTAREIPLENSLAG